MKNKEDQMIGEDTLNLIGLLFWSIILLFILGCGLSIYESIKVSNELNHRQQTQKVEINQRKIIEKVLIEDIKKER